MSPPSPATAPLPTIPAPQGAGVRPSAPACPVCGAGPAFLADWLIPGRPARGRAQPAAGYDIAALGAPEGGMRLVRCRACVFAWNPEPPPDDLYDYPVQEAYVAEAANRIRTARDLLARLPGPPAGRRLLDVGCSAGYLLRAAADLGYDARGIEPSRWAAEHGARELGVRIEQGFFAPGRFPAGSFDVVCLADVIEHGLDFDRTLGAARDCLAPGGHLLCVTPDLSSLAARLLGRRWWSVKREHVACFSRGSFARVAARHGFVPVAAGTHGRWFSLAYWAGLLAGTPASWARTRLGAVPLRLDLRDQSWTIHAKGALP